MLARGAGTPWETVLEMHVKAECCAGVLLVGPAALGEAAVRTCAGRRARLTVVSATDGADDVRAALRMASQSGGSTAERRILLVHDVDADEAAVCALLAEGAGDGAVMVIATAMRRVDVMPAKALRAVWPVHIVIPPPSPTERLKTLQMQFPEMSMAALDHALSLTCQWPAELVGQLRLAAGGGQVDAEHAAQLHKAARLEHTVVDDVVAVYVHEEEDEDEEEEEIISVQIGVVGGLCGGEGGLVEHLRGVAPALAVADDERHRRLHATLLASPSLLDTQTQVLIARSLCEGSSCSGVAAVNQGMTTLVIEVPSTDAAMELVRAFGDGRLSAVDGRVLMGLSSAESVIHCTATQGDALRLRGEFEVGRLARSLPATCPYIFRVRLPEAFDDVSQYEVRHEGVEAEVELANLRSSLRGWFDDGFNRFFFSPEPGARDQEDEEGKAKGSGKRKRRDALMAVAAEVAAVATKVNKGASKKKAKSNRGRSSSSFPGRPRLALTPLFKSYTLDEQSCHTDTLLEALWTLSRHVAFDVFVHPDGGAKELLKLVREHFARRAEFASTLDMATSRDVIRPVLCNGDDDASDGGEGNLHHLWSNFARAVPVSVATTVQEFRYECSSGAACRRPEKAHRSSTQLLALPFDAEVGDDPLAVLSATLETPEEQMHCYVVNTLDDEMDPERSCDNTCTVTRHVVGEPPLFLAVGTHDSADVDVDARLAALGRHQRSTFAGFGYELVHVALHEDEPVGHFTGYYRVPSSSDKDLWVRYDDCAGFVEAHADLGLGPEKAVSPTAKVTLLLYRRLEGTAVQPLPEGACTFCGSGTRRGRGISPPNVRCMACGSLSHQVCTGGMADGKEWTCFSCRPGSTIAV